MLLSLKTQRSLLLLKHISISIRNKRSSVDRFASLGFESQAGSPEMLDKKIKLETVKWAKAIKDAGMEAE